MDCALTPKCVAQSRPTVSGDDSSGQELHDGDNSFKNAQWSPDGTCLIATSDENEIHTFVVPADLLADRTEAVSLSTYSMIPSSEPVLAVAGFPSFQLQENWTALILSSIRDHPIRLSSALEANLVASYPLVNPMTEEFVSPHSLAFSSKTTHFVAGSDSLISTFDTSRLGQEPVTVVQTGPKNSKDDRWNPAKSMRGIVSALAIEPGSSILAAGTFTRQVALYESDGQGDCIGSFSVAGNEADSDIGGRGITQLHWSPCGRYLYLAERKSDGVMIYDIRQTGQLLSWVRGRNAHTNQRLGVDLSVNNSSGSYEVWAGGVDGKVRRWKDAHLKQGAVKADVDFKAHEDPVTSVVVHRAGGVVATSSGQDRLSSKLQTENANGEDPRLKIWTL